MAINVRIRNGMCPDPTTGDGGATEGDIRGSFSDIIDTIGVVDLANGHCLVTENSPAGLSVLVAPGIVYVPNADYDELDSNEPKFYEAIINAEGEVAITANTSGSTRIDLICVKVDKTITPDEHASNIATLVAVAGTPGAGAPTLPDNHAKLAEIEVADDAATIVNADITDSRVQAKINSDYIGASSSDLTMTSSPASDHTASGNKCVLNANENQAFGDVCFINADGQAQLGDADAIATSSCVAMCADATISANADGNYLLLGFARDDTWNWTVGGLIYLSTTGTTGNTLTQTAPSGTDDVIQILGVATNADRMLFNPQLVQVEHT